MSYRIITDNCCDFPADMYTDLDLSVIPLIVRFQNEEVSLYSERWLKKMYAGMREGEMATTSAANPQGWEAVIEPVLADGQDALVLTFSSGLSTTYQSAVIAAAELAEKYPDRKIRVIDTLCASLGQGLLVWYACKKRSEGMGLCEWAADIRHGGNSGHHRI